MNKKINITTYHVSFIAIAIALNIVGGQIALHLHLPIYLDSIGTFLIAIVCGPIYGMIPNTLSGIVMWMLGDSYALAYAPVGIVLGLLVGKVCKNRKESILWILLMAFVVSLPTSLISASITAKLFGGITSSGSTFLVQVLAKFIGLTPACFVIQMFTDYIDRVVSLVIVTILIKRLPSRLLQKFNKNSL